jgi:hypothetical protein
MAQITPEIAKRLKENLIFDNEPHDDVLGAINILFRAEDRESIKELFSYLHALAHAEGIVGLEVQLPSFEVKELTESPIEEKEVVPETPTTE